MNESEYMHFAKTGLKAEWNLATSGVVPCSAGELGILPDDIEINGPSYYGYEPLQLALAEKCGVAAGCAVAATGTSMANFLAMGVLVQPGDPVLIEQPTYDPLLAVARYLRADIRRFQRRRENNFQVDTDELLRLATPGIRLIVLTNLHNPTGAYTDAAVLREIGAIADACGARVLVDEVYLECSFPAPGSPESAFHLGPQFLVTGSLTKAYGLGGLRCGWALAEPQLALRMWRLNDLFGVVPAHPAERLSVLALRRLPELAARAKGILEPNRRLLYEFLDTHPQLDTVRPASGTVAFPRLATGDADAFCNKLRDEYQTAVVPGRYFEMPDHFRIGIGCSRETMTAGLLNLHEALKNL